MQVETSRFGTLEIDETAIITFPDGLPGFEAHRRFAFVPHRMPDPDKPSPFVWFQSLEDGRLAFLITNPLTFFPDYEPVLSASDRNALAADEDGAALSIYALLTVPSGNPSGITANLLAPLVINTANLRARQVIVNDDRFGLRHRLIADAPPAAREPEIVSRPTSAPQEYVAHR
jgi:flagellar assembly factor FliW